MDHDDVLLAKRLIELSKRSYARGRYEFSSFLSLSEQDVLSRLELDSSCSPFSLHGGFDGAERKIVVFGSEDICGYDAVTPLSWIRISPLMEKFSDDLTHRDFLGSLMGLGIKREMLGDISISQNDAYLVCIDSIASFIADNLTQVKRTTIKVRILSEAPEIVTRLPDPQEVVIASERVDAVVAATYHLSRSESQDLISAKRIFIFGKAVQSPGILLKSGDIISVRGLGRFIYEGIARETRKNKLRATIRKFV